MRCPHCGAMAGWRKWAGWNCKGSDVPPWTSDVPRPGFLPGEVWVWDEAPGGVALADLAGEPWSIDCNPRWLADMRAAKGHHVDFCRACGEAVT